MKEIEKIQMILSRFKKSKKFKHSGYSIEKLENCGEGLTIDISDNKNPGHSFEMIFDKDGKLTNLDFGF